LILRSKAGFCCNGKVVLIDFIEFFGTEEEKKGRKEVNQRVF